MPGMFLAHRPNCPICPTPLHMHWPTGLWLYVLGQFGCAREGSIPSKRAIPSRLPSLFDPAAQGVVGVDGQGEVVVLGFDLGEPVPGVIFVLVGAVAGQVAVNALLSAC